MRRRKQQRLALKVATGLRRSVTWLWVVALVLLLGLSWHPQAQVNMAEAATTIQPPLSTRGSQIIDAKGSSVLLRGVNWFGMETDLHVPHGLWVRDYKDMLAQIKTLGYNVIRLPYSVNALRSSNISGIDFSGGKNQDLQGKTPLQVMDLVIQEANKQGLFILLDSHRLNDYSIPELWYGDGFTEADWINTWKMLAVRYKNQPNVIGADLKNEPHGRASWGTNDQATDWRLAAERAGNAILAINPNWLIVVEGVQNNVPGQQLSGHWYGGNLEGVRKYPVHLKITNKLVYSPHEYGPGVYNQPWFYDANFPNNLYSRWATGFQYIATNKIAPILIGEFGGRQVDSSSREGIWQRQFVNYIKQNNLSFTYWSWNPNSGDTGGILQDDWINVVTAKQDLLKQLLNNLSSLAPSSTPTPTPTTTPSQGANLQTKSVIDSDWQTGFCVRFQVTNQGNTSIQNWKLIFQMLQAQINNSWNGNFTKQGSQYVVTPAASSLVIQPNQTQELGFCADKLGPDYVPTQVNATSL